jgi:hypothetical protein
VSAAVVAAYCAQPADARADHGRAAVFARRLLDETGAAGLEVPWGSDYVADPPRLEAELGLGLAGTHVLTLVPATMQRGAGFGIASLDPRCRAAALALARDARDAISRIVERAGPGSVAAVHLPSAPRADPARLPAHRHALVESLSEIASWDWYGARVMLEHCDSISGVRPQKGFLPLQLELAALTTATGPTPLGIAINWGRSAIETQGPDGPLLHLAAAVAAGLPVGLGISGAGPSATPLGGAWSDSHLPVLTPVSAAAGFGASLLTPARLAAFCAAAPPSAITTLTTLKVAAPAADPLALVADSFAAATSASAVSFVSVV